MPSVINTNVASLNAQRNLNTSQSALATSLQRLSSGLRINSAKDDAAGMAIADRMTSQIRGLNQAARNANDGISLAQTAEGGLSSVNENLQRMRELAVQSANSTNSASDRASLNAEVQTLLSEISRVAQTTQFNGLNLLDGTFASSQFQVGANANQTISVSIAGASTSMIGAFQQTGSAVTSSAFTGANFSITPNGGNAVTIGQSVATGSAGNNLVTADSAAAKAVAINAKTAETGVSATASNSLVAALNPTAHSGTLAAGALVINGVAIGAIAAGDTAVTQGTNAATAINAQTSLTGVTATADASTGRLTLATADGRNIEITAGTGYTDGNGITAIQNATGLDASTGTNASGNDTFGITVAGAFNTTPTADSLTEGDAFTLDGITYEFTTDATITSGRVGITVANGNTAIQVATAMSTAINAQYNLGNTTVSAANGGTAVVTVTNSKVGASGTLSGYSETVNATVGAGALAQGAETAGTDATYAAGGVTTRGTITLSSGAAFAVSGSEAAYAGLSTSSATLSKLSTVNISTVTGSNSALSIIDGALSQINTMRANLGATQNRFSATVTNLQTSSENISAARSRIRDADFAAETAELTRNQILQQAGTAMLAQANSLPQTVLSLLQ